MTTPGRRFVQGFALFVSTDCLTREPSAIGRAMAQDSSFARSLAWFMATRVIWFELGFGCDSSHRDHGRALDWLVHACKGGAA